MKTSEWWNHPRVAKERSIVIVKRGEEFSDAMITQALRVSEHTSWWMALVQLIEQYREQNSANAAAACGQNNAMATAAAVGAYEQFTEFLADLEKRRSTKD